MRSAPYHSTTASKYGTTSLDDEAGPTVERAPDPEGDREPVAPLDPPVARTEQTE